MNHASGLEDSSLAVAEYKLAVCLVLHESSRLDHSSFNREVWVLPAAEEFESNSACAALTQLPNLMKDGLAYQTRLFL